MLKLYHNAISTCSQKVRLVIAHKGLEFDSQDVDLFGGGQHEPEYVKLNPNHVVPTLVHNGEVLIESTLINEYLEDAYPQVPMMPVDPAIRHSVRMITKRLDEKVHPVTGIITFAIGPRSLLLQQPKAAREANINAIPDPVRRAARRSVIEHGVKAPEFSNAISVMLAFMETMNESLEEKNWLSGESFGLADAAVLPYVLRLDHLTMTPVLEARPHLMAWYQRVQALNCFETAVTARLAPPLMEMFRKNGQAVWADVEPMTH